MINAMELFDFASEDISMEVLFLWILTGFIGKKPELAVDCPKRKDKNHDIHKNPTC